MSVAQMAREFGATERTLERRFRRAIGVPPQALRA
ncbi:AraC family transcriptional regulator [Variovorax sp. MHTC-1]|nr:AraC family transcriptional regulator [Variovorax sp. MHTC-1]RST47899.1 AraC family transcriptional regulator [Variovorax sp. MHTC-1]